MDDADEKSAQLIRSTRRAAGRDDRSVAAESLHEQTESEAGIQEERVGALIRLATLEQKVGRRTEAERLLAEAVAIGAQLGAAHPSIGAALNELSRLYIRQSDYARAEPVLERLLQIARGKGDRHPDVATALAGLAAAKRGLGDDAAAERSYRDALRIREEVLAPEHMAIVVTLEQLAETIAARGNFAEALVHLQRALLRRERVLGAEHATVHALRGRIADLERLHRESVAEPADHPAVAPATTTAASRAPLATPAPIETPPPGPTRSARTTPDWRATPVQPLPVTSRVPQTRRPGELAFLYQPTPPASRPALPPRERTSAPSRPVPAPSPTADPAPTLARTESVAPARTTAPTQGAALSPRPVAMSPVLAIAAAPVFGASPPDISSLIFAVKRTTRYASAGAAVVALAIAGFDFGYPLPAEIELRPASPRAAAQSAVVTPASNVVAQQSMVPSTSVALATDSSPVPDPNAALPAPAEEMRAESPAAPVAVPKLRRLVVPKIATPSVDSLMRVASRIDRDAGLGTPAVGSSVLSPAQNDDADVKPPVLVYSPVLRFPDALRTHRVEGEVVVQFRVNEKGRVEPSSMQVMRSEHELFSEAVRSVLPRFRFEPARAAAPGSKPQAAWVQFRAQFTARN